MDGARRARRPRRRSTRCGAAHRRATRTLVRGRAARPARRATGGVIGRGGAVRLGRGRAAHGRQALLLPAARDAARAGSATASPREPIADGRAVRALRAARLRSRRDRLSGPLLRARSLVRGAARGRRLLVGLDCVDRVRRRLLPSTSTRGRSRARGFDLDLTPLPDGRVVVAWGERGRTRRARRPPGSRDGRRRRRGARRSPTLRGGRGARAFRRGRSSRAALARMNAAPARRRSRDDEWQALGPACLACTGCTSLCPTCSCFTVVDEATRRRRRARARLGQLPPRRLPARGVRAPSRAASRRSRAALLVPQALATTSPRDFGRVGCVGCGRCDVTCPGIDRRAARARHSLGARR